MDQLIYVVQSNPVSAKLMGIVTVLGGITAGIPDLDLYLRIGGFLIALVAGWFTCSYHIAARKKAKKEIELLDRQLQQYK
jgi:hypothetical protein